MYITAAKLYSPDLSKDSKSFLCKSSLFLYVTFVFLMVLLLGEKKELCILYVYLNNAFVLSWPRI